jgi:hypothetical protein
VIELRDPSSDYALRMTLLSATINSVHVRAPANQAWVSIEPDTNASNPFGGGWSASSGSGIRILNPGDTLTWKVRLELFTVTATRNDEP